MPDPTRRTAGAPKTTGPAVRPGDQHVAIEDTREVLPRGGSLRDFDLPTTLEWPPIARAFAEGRRPSITRRGWRVFWAWRREEGGVPPVAHEELPANEETFIEFLVEGALRRCETSRD